MALLTVFELILVLAAGILAAISIVETRGRSWMGWGVICLALAMLLLHFLH